jgi:hypothetical protein
MIMATFTRKPSSDRITVKDIKRFYNYSSRSHAGVVLKRIKEAMGTTGPLLLDQLVMHTKAATPDDFNRAGQIAFRVGKSIMCV